MISNEHITASWARQTANEQLGEKAQKQLNEILQRIKEAVAGNKLSTTANSIDDINKKELQIRGFKLDYVAADPRDQRESSYYNISW